jgi:hypothetical protein
VNKNNQARPSLSATSTHYRPNFAGIEYKREFQQSSRVIGNDVTNNA